MNRSYENSAQSQKVKYSAAYSKGREPMLEPLYGCAEEALLRRVASPYGEPEGPSRGRARAYRSSTRARMMLTTEYTKYTKECGMCRLADER